VGTRDGKAVVFLIQGDQVREVPVGLDRRLGEMVELREGPAVGSRIATAPLEKLKDGTRVSIPKQ
jgi:multidrug efflux pump subunit AcrA (membrane-fusion protein)